jgi:hypothetical protein
MKAPDAGASARAEQTEKERLAAIKVDEERKAKSPVGVSAKTWEGEMQRWQRGRDLRYREEGAIKVLLAPYDVQNSSSLSGELRSDISTSPLITRFT